MVEGQPEPRTGKLGYLEIPAADVSRSAEFYRQVFGWVISAAADGPVCFDDAVRGVRGTFVTGRAPAPEPGLGLYLTVPDMADALAAVNQAGGAVQDLRRSATDDTIATFRDPADNILGLYQPAPTAPPDEPPVANAPDAAAAGPAEVGVDLDRLLDLATPWCLRVAATVRIPEHIAAGRTEIAALAAAAGCDQDALHAVLSHLVSCGVLTEAPPGHFRANQASRQLAEPSHFLDLDGIGGRFAHTWGTLLDYVRTGESAYEQRFGLPFWEDLAAHPRLAADFDALMGPVGHGVPDYDIELTAGWDRVRTVVDVGGGTGALLAALLQRHPQTQGILVDLPGPVARSAEIMRAAGVADRVTTQAQSFFDPLPAGADLYVLKSVLNDWPDEPTVAILRRCAQAAQPGGTIVVLGGVSADESPRSVGIDMLVAGGKDSTLTQFTELAQRAGLDVLTAGTQPSGRYVVECRPASSNP
jgi:predicted enzyme related to lactoylglutathione lyase